MAPKNSTYKKALDFIEVVKIGREIFEESDLIDQKTKDAFAKSDNYTLASINQMILEKNLTYVKLKYLIDPYFVYWNESVSIEVEKFWFTLKKQSFDFIRKDPLQFTLNKRKFRNVHQGMSARKNWQILKESKFLRNRFKKEDLEVLNKIIIQDEIERVELLKNCLKKKSIPQSKYLKFGESIAYLEYCSLVEAHFNQSEYDELYTIWNSFK